MNCRECVKCVLRIHKRSRGPKEPIIEESRICKRRLATLFLYTSFSSSQTKGSKLAAKEEVNESAVYFNKPSLTEDPCALCQCVSPLSALTASETAISRSGTESFRIKTVKLISSTGSGEGVCVCVCVCSTAAVDCLQVQRLRVRLHWGLFYIEAWISRFEYEFLMALNIADFCVMKSPFLTFFYELIDLHAY